MSLAQSLFQEEQRLHEIIDRQQAALKEIGGINEKLKAEIVELREQLDCVRKAETRRNAKSNGHITPARITETQ